MIQIPPSPVGAILPRRATGEIMEALADTRVVLVNGARQSGKSTLVSQIGNDIGAHWRSLDNAKTREFAATSPGEFVETAHPMIIDEIQRDPELLLSIKESVDRRPQPGKFLLTGSARIMGLRNLPDTLVGRMQTIELWPLSQGEIDGKPDGFVEAVFNQGIDFRHTTAESRRDYIDRLVRGGYPEAITRTPKRRREFYQDYISDMINRDVMELSMIGRQRELRQLVELVAAQTGQLVVPEQLAKRLGINRNTVMSYLTLLEEVFLIKTIPAWRGSLSSRVTATPKIAMVDSGIAAALMRVDAHRLRQPDAPLGPLLESFVSMEIARQLTWSGPWVEQYHYRTKDKIEVDIVLDNGPNEIVGIEVKAAEVIRAADFNGLRHLRKHVGDAFKVGIVLYAGEHTMVIDDKILAVPIAALWEAEAPS